MQLTLAMVILLGGLPVAACTVKIIRAAVATKPWWLAVYALIFPFAYIQATWLAIVSDGSTILWLFWAGIVAVSIAVTTLPSPTLDLTYQYPQSQAVVFSAAETVLAYSRTRVKDADSLAGSISASTAMTAASWGEQIKVLVSPASTNSSLVTVRSQLSFGIISWGVNRKNVEKLHAQLVSYLQATGAGASGWYPDPFGTVRARYFDGSAWLDGLNRPMFDVPALATAVAQEGLTPVGWHLDPAQTGLVRYWDGHQWTDETVDLYRRP
jgi:hypothetical protein